MLTIRFDRDRMQQFVEWADGNLIKDVRTSSDYLMLAAACWYGAHKECHSPAYVAKNQRVNEAHDELSEAIAGSMDGMMRVAFYFILGLDALRRTGKYDEAFESEIEFNVEDKGIFGITLTGEIAGGKPGYREMSQVNEILSPYLSAADEEIGEPCDQAAMPQSVLRETLIEYLSELAPADRQEAIADIKDLLLLYTE